MCFTASCKNARFYLCAELVSVPGLGWKRGGHQLMCTAVCYSKDRGRTLKRTDNCVHYGAFKIEIAKECKPTDQIVCPRFMCVLFIEWAQWQPLMYSHRCYRHQAALFLVSFLFLSYAISRLTQSSRPSQLFVCYTTNVSCRVVL